MRPPNLAPAEPDFSKNCCGSGCRVLTRARIYIQIAAVTQATMLTNSASTW